VTEWLCRVYRERGGGDSYARAHWPNVTVSKREQSGEGV